MRGRALMGLPGKAIPIIVEPLRLPEPARAPEPAPDRPAAPAPPAKEPLPQR